MASSYAPSRSPFIRFTTERALRCHVRSWSISVASILEATSSRRSAAPARSPRKAGEHRLAERDPGGEEPGDLLPVELRQHGVGLGPPPDVDRGLDRVGERDDLDAADPGPPRGVGRIEEGLQALLRVVFGDLDSHVDEGVGAGLKAPELLRQSEAALREHRRLAVPAQVEQRDALRPDRQHPTWGLSDKALTGLGC